MASHRVKFRVQAFGASPGPGNTLAAEDLIARLAAVAEEHAPDGGYGDTAWNEGEALVFWVSADWSSNDEVAEAIAAFMAVPGVEAVESEAEAALPSGDGWVRVWPAPDSDLALARLVQLASRPL